MHAAIAIKRCCAHTVPSWAVAAGSLHYQQSTPLPTGHPTSHRPPHFPQATPLPTKHPTTHTHLVQLSRPGAEELATHDGLGQRASVAVLHHKERLVEPACAQARIPWMAVGRLFGGSSPCPREDPPVGGRVTAAGAAPPTQCASECKQALPALLRRHGTHGRGRSPGQHFHVPQQCQLCCRSCRFCH